MSYNPHYHNFRENREHRPMSEHPHGGSSDQAWRLGLYGSLRPDPIERPRVPSPVNARYLYLRSPGPDQRDRPALPVALDPQWQDGLSRVTARVQEQARQASQSERVGWSQSQPHQPDISLGENHYVFERKQVLRDSSTRYRYPQEVAELIIEEFFARIDEAPPNHPWRSPAFQRMTILDMNAYFHSHDSTLSPDQLLISQGKWNRIARERQKTATNTIAYTEFQILKKHPNALPGLFSTQA